MLLKVEQVAETLQVDPFTIYKWVKRGELKAFNVSLNPSSKKPRLRFRPEDVEEFLENRIPKQETPRRFRSRISASWKARMAAVGMPVK